MSENVTSREAIASKNGVTLCNKSRFSRGPIAKVINTAEFSDESFADIQKPHGEAD